MFCTKFIEITQLLPGAKFNEIACVLFLSITKSYGIGMNVNLKPRVRPPEENRVAVGTYE